MSEKLVVFITGASSGFGRITATMLAAKGCIVYGTSRKAMPDKPAGVNMLKVDVTIRTSIQEAVNQIVAEQGRLDVVVNNAGGGISGALELATTEEIEWQMHTNFMSVVHVCSCVLPVMRKAGKGRIINISSIGGVIAVPFQGFYSASKFAVEGYSEALAAEVHPFGIDICLVEPGDFHTNFTANRNISAVTLSHPAYQDNFSRTMKIIEEAENKGSKPEILGRTICKLIDARCPAFRTKIGPADQVLFARCKGWLPDKLVQYIIRLFYKI